MILTRKLIHATCYSQIIWISIASILGIVFKSWSTGLGIFIGGMTWFLPFLYFTIKISKASSPSQNNQTNLNLWKIFCFCELKKLGFSAILIILCVKFLPFSVLSLLIGYIVSVISFWSYPLFIPKL